MESTPLQKKEVCFWVVSEVSFLHVLNVACPAMCIMYLTAVVHFQLFPVIRYFLVYFHICLLCFILYIFPSLFCQSIVQYLTVVIHCWKRCNHRFGPDYSGKL